MKTTKMAGFLCQSPLDTAVCMTVDPRSAVVPRRPERRYIDNSRLIDLKYSRLIDSRRRFQQAGKPAMAMTTRRDCNPSKTTTSSSLPTSHHVFQVVVMRVSLHCQGCAGKVKKHLSKMEGVTSFSIDLESKRVTVMGHVSPVGVLESISKVKKAEFWPC